MSSHFIRKTVFDVEIDIPQNEARTKSDMLFDKHILPALNKVFQHFEETDITVERPLEINLGKITETDLTYTIENALYQVLSKYRQNSLNPTLPCNIQTTEKARDIFFDYLQKALIPWDIDEADGFDIQHIVHQSIAMALKSNIYSERLVAIVCESVETCKRFFELPFKREDFLSILKILIPKIPVKEATLYSGIINLVGQEIAPFLFQEISYYVVSRMLFGNRRESVRSLTVAILLLMSKGYLKKKDIPRILKPVNDKIRLQNETKTSIASSSISKNKIPDKQEMFYSDERTEQKKREGKIREEENYPPDKNFSGDTSELEKTLESIKRKIRKEKILRQNPKSTLSPAGAKRAIIRTKENQTEKETAEESSHDKKIQQLIRLFDEIREETENFSGDTSELEKTLESIRQDIQKTPDNTVSKIPEADSDILTAEDILHINTAIESLRVDETNEKKPQIAKSGIKEITATIICRQPEIKERIPIYNAGLVLLHPFLISFFDKLGLLEYRKHFKSAACQIRAAHLLHELSGFGKDPLEHLMLFNKLLCGINIMFPINAGFKISENEKQETEKLLKAVIRNWSIIKNTSVAGLQESFVKRKGVLEQSQNDWILRVETKGIDILLDDIPWNIHIISFPWNDFLIHVDWKL